MNAFKALQREYDNRLPPPVSETPREAAAEEWIESGVDELLNCGDVKFQRRFRKPQGVTFEQFATAVDMHVIEACGRPGASPSVIGRLVLLGRVSSLSEIKSAADEAIGTADPRQTLREIAETLLRPLAGDALIAQAEDDDL
jgi:hypothetical protein